MSREHRGSLVVEEAAIIAHDSYPGSQWVLRAQAPAIAARATPGTFVHVRCDASLPMRRPLSIMRVHPDEGWVELLYKVVGEGTRALSAQPVGVSVSLLGPVGRPFVPSPDRPRALLIGGGVGIPPMVFLAERLRRSAPASQPFVIMGSEVPFPFTPRPSAILVPGMPEGTIAAMPLMEDWGIASRLASLQGYPGCFDGYVTVLARAWLDALADDTRAQVAVYACGPTPMLRAVAELAEDYDLPCQVSLEEFMACAVGGCAGCTVRVRTPEGDAMRRVCVDGPVFDSREVLWAFAH